jgi:hypothetical protein
MASIAEGVIPSPTAIAYTYSSPYVVPFDTFDHVHKIPVSGCGTSAAGVGVFIDNPPGALRRIERLTVSADSYTMSELDTPGDVVTFDIVPGTASDAIAGVIEDSPDGSIFAAYQVTGCDNWTLLAGIQTDFDWRQVPAPGLGTGSLIPKTEGVQIIGWRVNVDGMSTSNQYEFVHYDGYSVRAWTVDMADATIGFSLFQLHSDRSDLSVL